MITKKGNEYLVILIVLNTKKLTRVIFVNLLSRFPLLYESKVVLLESGRRTVGVVVLPVFLMYSGLVRFGLSWLLMILMQKPAFNLTLHFSQWLEPFWNYAAILDSCMESNMCGLEFDRFLECH